MAAIRTGLPTRQYESSSSGASVGTTGAASASPSAAASSAIAAATPTAPQRVHVRLCECLYTHHFYFGVYGYVPTTARTQRQMGGVYGTRPSPRYGYGYILGPSPVPPITAR